MRTAIVVIGIGCLGSHISTKLSLEKLDRLLRWTLIICVFISLIAMLIGVPIPGSVGYVGGGTRSLSNKLLGSLISLNAGLWMLNFFDKPKNRWVSVIALVISVVSIFITVQRVTRE